MKIAISVQCT